MDISTLKAIVAQDDEPIVVPIYQKSGEPYVSDIDGSEATITVVGSESKRLRQAKLAQTRKMLNSRRQKMTAEDVLRARIDSAAAGVVEWHGWEENGKPWPCEPDNVRTLLGVEHILEQVEAGIAGHADFFKTASTDS